MKFTKMQGCGNDYIYVNGFTEYIVNKEEMVRRLSDRHFGIGGDGVIFINPSEIADFEMEMYNADGSRSEMCGNGIRCVGKYVYDYHLTDKTSVSIESFGKIKYLDLTVEQGQVVKARVNMGRPELKAELVPVLSENETVCNEGIVVDDREYHITAVSMGNPHAVVFLDTLEGLEMEHIGPLFERHERFPRRVNTEFVEVIDKQNVRMRVYERGTGETLACGTGCCAVGVACVLNQLTQRKITVHVLGGEILIEWNEADGCVYMTGDCVTVFEGNVNL